MKLYAVISFMRMLHGAKYQIQAIYEEPSVAETEIKAAAERDDIELKKVGDASWKGGGVIVTIHEVELERMGTERMSALDLTAPAFVLGESEMPFDELRRTPLDVNDPEVRKLKEVLSKRSKDGRDQIALRERHARACHYLRDVLYPDDDDQREAGGAGAARVNLARELLTMLDPNQVFDDGD